jgi:hypothetical protein
MDNKYGLGSDKVSAEIHDRHQKASSCFNCQAIHCNIVPPWQIISASIVVNGKMMLL